MIDPVARTVESLLLPDLAGNAEDITNAPGQDLLFVVRDTSGDSQIDFLDPVTRTLTGSVPVPTAGTPVGIADGPDGRLYVLGLGGALASLLPDGGNPDSLILTPPSGSYVGLTSFPGSRLLYLVRDTSGDSTVDTYDVDTGSVRYDVVTFPLPSTPVGITDGPTGLLHVVGAGGAGPAAYVAIDPSTESVVLAHAFMDFVGSNVALTNLTSALVVAADPPPSAAPEIVHRAVPNPFNPRTRIEFVLPATSPVDLTVYDVAGRRVRTLAAGTALAAGRHALTWDGRSERGEPLASGTYFYRLSTRFGADSGALTLVK